MNREELIERIKAVRDDGYLSATYLGDEHVGDLMGDILAALEQSRTAEQGEAEWGVGWRASWTDRVLGFAMESRAEAEEHARQSNADPDDNLRYFVVQRTPERAPGWWVPVNENGDGA